MAVYVTLALAQYAPGIGGQEFYPFASFNLYRRPFRTQYQLAYRCAADREPPRMLTGGSAAVGVRPVSLAAPCLRLPDLAPEGCQACGAREVGWVGTDFRQLALGSESGKFSAVKTCPCRD